MEEVEKAYLAGIIDGEGTVTLMRHHQNETPAPYVAISNNDLKLLHWVKKKIGAGTITTKPRREQHHKDSYTWCLRFDKAIAFLNSIKGYLIIKRRQADLIVKEYKSVTSRSGRYTPELLRRKIKLVAKVKELNQR